MGSKLCDRENQTGFSSRYLTAGADSGRLLSVLTEWSVSIWTALPEALVTSEIDA